MTVSSTTNTNSYTGNGTNHSFAYGFKIFASADIEVIVRSTAGVETTKTLNTHYIVTNAGTDSGGNVLFKFNTGTSSDAHYSTTDYRPANNETVLLRRNLTLTQGTDYIENDTFASTSHENALDRLTFITQALQEESDRSLKISKTNTMTSTQFTTSATDRANKILSFNASGELAITQELGTFKGNSATTTTAAFTVRDIVKATTTAQLNNIYICVADSVVGDALTDTDHFALLVDAVAAAASATTASTKAGEASTSASTATTKAGEAATSATNAAASLTTFTRQYHGAASSDPSSNLDAGDLYFKTDGSGMKVYTGSAWADVKPTSSEQTNINTVAGANSNISALAASAVITDMGLLATDAVIADMAQLANSTIIDDLAILANSTITDDMAILATSANVTAMGLLGTSANVTAQGLLGTSGNVTAMGLLGTSAVVEDMGLLGVAGVIEDMGILGTSANVTAMSNVSGSIANVNTVASNVSGVNSFADRYRVASSAPSSSLDVGDLYFDTSANELKVYKSSGWAAAGSTVNGTSARFHYDIGSAVTSVTGNDAAGNALAYDAGFIDVYVNGVRMSTADVTITSGDTVTFASALASGDEVDIVAFGTFAVANIVSTGALNSGSITSGFGNINTGSSTITTTGVGTFGSLDISGDIDVDGTTNLDVVDIDGAVNMATTALVTGVLTANGGAVFNEGSADVDFRVESNGDANMLFVDAGNDRIGVGTASPATQLNLQSAVNATGYIEMLRLEGQTLSNGWERGITFTGNDGGLEVSRVSSFLTGAERHLRLTSAGTLGMTIREGGKVQIGSDGVTDGFLHIKNNFQSDIGMSMNDTSGSGGTAIRFKINGTTHGSIAYSGSGTAYNTSSDYRLKENVDYTFDATTRLKQLKPARFNFIADADTTVDGFLAHEVSSIVPEAISGTKDAVEVWKDSEELPNDVSVGDNKLDSDGNTIPVMQAIDQSKIVPLLTKALQEQQATIEALTARIVTLENA